MIDMDQPYIPISCSFYDYLEEAATRGEIATIEFLEENTRKLLRSRIKTFIVKEKMEFMVLEDGTEIRLDFLISFNGKPLPKAC